VLWKQLTSSDVDAEAFRAGIETFSLTKQPFNNFTIYFRARPPPTHFHFDEILITQFLGKAKAMMKNFLMIFFSRLWKKSFSKSY
jgi:hypothetical protein